MFQEKWKGIINKNIIEFHVVIQSIKRLFWKLISPTGKFNRTGWTLPTLPLYHYNISWRLDFICSPPVLNSTYRTWWRISLTFQFNEKFECRQKSRSFYLDSLWVLSDCSVEGRREAGIRNMWVELECLDWCSSVFIVLTLFLTFVTLHLTSRCWVATLRQYKYFNFYLEIFSVKKYSLLAMLYLVDVNVLKFQTYLLQFNLIKPNCPLKCRYERGRAPGGPVLICR